MRRYHLITLAVVLLSASSCLHKTVVHPSPSPQEFAPDNSYFDLVAGGHLRIVIPQYNSNAASPVLSALPSQDGSKTMALTVANLTGYIVSHYSVASRRGGRVELHFESAELSKEGKSASITEPHLAFALPAKAQFVRLIYLVRKSGADHNMAIAAAKNLPALNALTDRIKNSEAACHADVGQFCAWVPADVAVRPE